MDGCGSTSIDSTKATRLCSRESGPRPLVSCSTTGSCSWFPSPRASCSWPSGAGCLEGSSIGHPWRPRVLRQRRWAAQPREPTTTRTFRPSTSERFCLRRVPSSSQRSPQSSGPQLTGTVWSIGERHGPWLGSLRIFGLLGLGLLSAHAMIRWLDPSPHVPSQQDRAEARRLLAYLTEQGPEIFVPCHPFYSVLAGGSGHLHVMGVNDVYSWPRTITSDPGRDTAIKDRFRTKRDELLPVQAMEDGHPGRLPHASALWDQHATTASSRILLEVGRPLGP